jgi:hypothetical protein
VTPTGIELCLEPPERKPTSCGGGVIATGIDRCLEHDSAMGAGIHSVPESEPTGTVRTPESRHWSAHESSIEGSEQPQRQQHCCEHPQSMREGRVSSGVAPGPGHCKAKHHEPSKMGGNPQPQQAVVHHVHWGILLPQCCGRRWVEVPSRSWRCSITLIGESYCRSVWGRLLSPSGRRLAALGYSVHAISQATRLSVELVTRVLAEAA